MPNTSRRHRSHRPLSEAEREQRRAQQRELVADAVERLRSSDGWRSYLRARQTFHNYSLRNQLLIALQRPDATRVAGFHSWLKLGYCVRKGSTSIKIWARCEPSKTKLATWRRAGADPDERPRGFYRLVSVFDVSDVDPLPAPAQPADLTPPPIAAISGDSHIALLDALERLAGRHGYTVQVDELGAADGQCDRKAKTITLACRLEPNARVATLVHELAHALIPLVDGERVLSYAEEELVVESVAWCVCDTAGLDTTANSIPYMTSWSAGVSLEVLQQTAELVDRLTREIEGRVMAALDRDSAIDMSEGLAGRELEAV